MERHGIWKLPIRNAQGHGRTVGKGDTCTSSPMWMTMGAVGYSEEPVFNVSNAHVVDSDSECQIL